MKLSKRLQIICDLVDEGSSIIDVGCDHALIDIYLVQQKKVNAIAADVNRNALAIAKRNILSYHLENQIQTVLTDGVEGLSTKDKTILICGMGTQTMIDIINHMQEYDMKDMILQTNHDQEGLRRYLMDKGFEFIDEVYLKERGKSYLIMKVRLNKKNYSKVDEWIGPIIKKKYPDYVQEYLEKQRYILNKIPKTCKQQREELLDKIKKIEEELF